jgi:hypothetical protein
MWGAGVKSRVETRVLNAGGSVCVDTRGLNARDVYDRVDATIVGFRDAATLLCISMCVYGPTGLPALGDTHLRSLRVVDASPAAFDRL